MAKKKWKPSYGDIVWTFSPYLDELVPVEFTGNYNRDFKAGSIFSTYALAQAAFKKVKAILKGASHG